MKRRNFFKGLAVLVLSPMATLAAKPSPPPEPTTLYDIKHPPIGEFTKRLMRLSKETLRRSASMSLAEVRERRYDIMQRAINSHHKLAKSAARVRRATKKMTKALEGLGKIPQASDGLPGTKGPINILGWGYSCSDLAAFCKEKAHA